MLDFKACQSVSKNFLDRYIKNKSEILENDLSHYIMSSLQDLRNNDYYTYEQLEMLPSLKQKEVIETVLETNSLNTNILIKSIYETFFERLDDVLKNYNYIDNPQELCEIFLSEYKTKTIPVLEESIIDDAKEYIIKAKPIISNAISKYLPITSSIAVGVLYPYLGGSIITSLTGLLWIFIGTLFANQITSGKIMRDQLHGVSKIADVISTLSKSIKKASDHYKYRFNITFKNEEKCYKEAGLNINDIGIRMFTALREDSFNRQLLFFDEEKKMDKLRNCYLESYLDRISIFFDLYFDCLKKTGNWASIKELSDDKFIQMFRIKGGLYPICDEYRDNAVEAIDSFTTLVNFLFEKSPDKRSRWLMLLNRYILDKRTPKDQLIKNFKENQSKKPFINNKYNKLSKDL